jgi:hypothetical protein
MYGHYSFSLNIQRNAFKIGAENQIVGRITSHKMANLKAALNKAIKHEKQR